MTRRSLLLSALLLVLGFTASLSAGPPAHETPAEANAYLDRFVGQWVGTGSFDGTPVVESFDIARVLGGNFLLFRTREQGGAHFESDIYLGYDAARERYELNIFTNFTGFGGGLPKRHMTGERANADTLVMQEKPGKDPLRYTFELVDANTIRFTKAFVRGRNQQVIVVETLIRQP